MKFMKQITNNNTLNVKVGKGNTIALLQQKQIHKKTVNYFQENNFTNMKKDVTNKFQLLQTTQLLPSPPPLSLQQGIGSLPCNHTCCKTCRIHVPTQLLTSPNTSLTFPITPLADCKLSNLVYQLQCKKCNLFSLEEWVRCSQNV